MGFLAKRATRDRIAPISVPVQLPSDLIERIVATDAILRGAVIGLSFGGAYSSGMRGRQSVLAPIFKSGASSLWVRGGESEWYVALGTDLAGGGRAIDWQIKVDASTTGSLGLITTQALTKDDELVNGDVHDQLRQRVIDGFCGRFDSAGAVEDLERDVSEQSLANAPKLKERPLSGEWTFEVTTSLNSSGIEPALDRLGLPLVSRAEGHRRWHLGLTSAMGGYMEVAHAAGNGSIRLEGKVFLTPTGSFVADVIATRAGRTGCRRLKALIQRDDASAMWLGAESLAGSV